MKLSEEQFYAQRREERREARRAALAFARVCEDGRANDIENAALWLDECPDAWRIAFMAVARLKQVKPEVQDAFLTAWIERKHVPLSVGNRPVCAAALRVLLPRDYSGPPLMLYRGTRLSERTRRLYGFSWSRGRTEISRADRQPRHAACLTIGLVTATNSARYHLTYNACRNQPGRLPVRRGLGPPSVCLCNVVPLPRQTMPMAVPSPVMIAEPDIPPTMLSAAW